MEARDYRKLQWKIIIISFVFSLIPLFALGLTIYYQFSVSYTAKVLDNLSTLAENRKRSLDLFLEERLSQLVTLAHTHSLAQLKDEGYLTKVFNTMQTRSRSFIDLGIIEQSGSHLAYVGPYRELKAVNYFKEDWFQSTVSEGTYVSEVFLGYRRFPHFIIAVLNREGPQPWILRATINSDIIDTIVRAAQIGKKGDAFLINRRNFLQTAPRFSGELFAHPQTPDFSRITATRLGEVTINGEQSLMAATPLANKKWILVIKEDPREQLTALLKARNIGVFLILAGIFIIVLGTLFTTRAMIGRLVRLDRQKAGSEDLAIQSGKMAALGKMAAGIAHEINNPLAVIGEKAGWIKDLLAEEDLAQTKNLVEFENSVQKIKSHVERARKVTHRLLGFARRMEPVHEMVSINKILDDTIDFLENEARYLNIDIQTEYSEALPHIFSDSSQLQQVFLNILNNGIDAVGKNGEIVIKTAFLANNKEIAVEITDNRPGIPKEAHNKIFDLFYTSKEVGKGTGLGLSIVYSILEKLGGRIMVASETGKGTTFTIYLPGQ
jgi:two-component system NtrC family sensor kinase